MGVDTKAAQVFDDHRLFYSGYIRSFLENCGKYKDEFRPYHGKEVASEKKCYPYVFRSRIKRMLFRTLEK